MASSGTEFVTVKTRSPPLPFPPYSGRTNVHTERLTLRPPIWEDLEPLHTLRSQPEVMIWTITRQTAKDLEETRVKLQSILDSGDTTLEYAICLKDTGEFIGLGGCHPGRHGWPEVGYMIRSDFAGRGYATEFLKGWLGIWKGLPRVEREVSVQRQMLKSEGEFVNEQLTGITRKKNVASQRVLQKCGFEHFLDLTEPELLNKEELKELSIYRFFP